jgi:hypothetical protein
MQFAPKSKDELRPSLTDGEYSATVCKAEDKTSKTGNDMIALTLRVFSGENSVLVNDWLIPSTASMWKVFDFCEAAGLMARYEAGDLQAQDCLNADVFVKIKNEDGGDFGTQPRVKSYLKERTNKPTAAEVVARQNGPAGVPAAKGQAARKASVERQEAAPVGADSEDIPF